MRRHHPPLWQKPRKLVGQNQHPQTRSLSKLFGGFNRPDVGGGIGITDGVAFLIPFRLREHTSQLGLPRVRLLPFALSLRPTVPFSPPALPSRPFSPIF